MFKLFKIVLLILFITLFVYAKEKKPIDINIDNVSVKAKAEGKHILLYFYMTHCPYCKEIQEFTFKNKDIKNQLDKSFLFVDINIDDDGNIKYKNFFDSKRQFAKYITVDFYPTVIFLDEENTIVSIVKGYKTKNEFSKVLSYIKSLSYIDMTFEEYIDKLQPNK